MKSMISSRKAMLYSLTTAVLLFAVFMLALTAYHTNKSIAGTAASAAWGDRINAVADDIRSGIAADIFDINDVSISYGVGTNILINANTSFMSGKNYATQAAAYESLVEGTYARVNNMQILLNDFGPSIRILPGSGAIRFNETALILNNLSSASNITLQIWVNAANYTSVSETIYPGSKLLKIQLLNKTNSIIYDRQLSVDLTQQSSIQLAFSGGNLNIYTGPYAWYANTTLRLETQKQIVLKQLGLGLPETDNVRLTVGYLNIHMAGNNVSKSVPIYIN